MKKKSFKEFILSDKVYDTCFVVLMLGMLLIGFWFGIIETILKYTR